MDDNRCPKCGHNAKACLEYADRAEETYKETYAMWYWIVFVKKEEEAYNQWRKEFGEVNR